MTNVSADLIANAGPITLNETPASSSMVGGRGVSGDGRSFRYILAGGTTLVPGTLQQAPAEITAHQNLTPAAAAIGATTVTATLGATAAALNFYAGGLLVVTVTPGQGYAYRIKSNPAAALSTSLTVTLDDAILIALTTSSRFDLVSNPYSNVIINPSTATSAPIGLAVSPITNAQYGWLQVQGFGAVLADGTVTVGTDLVASNATAGAVEALTGVQAVVANALTGIATTEYGAVKLLIE